MIHRANVQLVSKPGAAGDKLRLRTWIEVQLLGEDGKPIRGQACEITLPGGKKVSGWLDENGVLRVDNTWAGNCQITFPDLDQDAWTVRET